MGACTVCKRSAMSHLPLASAYAAPGFYGGYHGHPGFGFDHGYHAQAHHAALAENLRAEEAFVQDRTRTLSELKTAEVNEASAIEKVRSDAHNAEVSLAEATEQSRRAATADSIHARAQEELRVRDAEAKAMAARAADAQALADRAKEALTRAQEALKAEAAAAEQKVAEARTAESDLAKSAAAENQTGATLSKLETAAMHHHAGFGHFGGPGFHRGGYW